MARSVKFLTPLTTVAVLFACAVVHARLIGHYPVFQEPRLGWEAVLTALVLLAAYAAGVNEPKVRLGARFLRSSGAVGSAIIVLSLVQLAAHQPLLPRFMVLMTVAAVIPAQTLLSALGERSRVQQQQLERVIAVIGGEEQERLAGDMAGPLELPAVLRAVADAKAVLPSDADPTPLLTLVKEHSATLVVLARDAQGNDEIVSQAAHLHRQGVRIRTLSLFYDEWLGKLPISELERIALLFDINELHRPLYARLKRFLDLLIAGPGLILFGLVAPCIALGNVIANPGPLLYRQTRVGKNGELFTILKFRTMKPDDGSAVWTAPSDSRHTPLGRLMRRSHLDELPQVWNVVRRDLSVVGPRPEQPQYVTSLSSTIPFYDTRHLVRPGITGWAQVKYGYGSSEMDALEKLQYEFYYLRHQNLGLDLRIIGRTLRSIVNLRGR